MENALKPEFISACLSADKLSLAVIDTTGHYVYVSPYWKELTGIEPPEIIYNEITYRVIPNSHFR